MTKKYNLLLLNLVETWRFSKEPMVEKCCLTHKVAFTRPLQVITSSINGCLHLSNARWLFVYDKFSKSYFLAVLFCKLVRLMCFSKRVHVNQRTQLYRIDINIWAGGKSLKGQLLKSYAVYIKKCYFLFFIGCASIAKHLFLKR